MNKEGVENAKKVLGFIVEGGNVAEMMKGQTGFVGKALALAPLFDEITALATLDLAGLKAEFKDGFNEDDKKVLMTFAKEKYDIENDVMESHVEAALDLVLEAADLVARIVALRCKLV